MGGICGVFSPGKKDVVERMLLKMSHRGAFKRILHAGEKGIYCLGRCTPEEENETGSKEKMPLLFEGEIYNAPFLKEKYGLAPRKNESSNIVSRLLSKFFEGNEETALKKSLALLDGGYVLAVYFGKSLFMARDVMGIHPLFFALKPHPAFASERKALWACGFSAIESLEPGCMLELSTMKRHRFSALKGSPIKDYDESIALLDCHLRKSVERMTRELKEYGILFSGGLDSTLLARLAKNPTLFVCGTQDSEDLSFARKASESLGLPLKEIVVDEKAIKESLCDVMYHCESKEPLNIGIALPLYFASKKASAYCKALLSGGGADELFGGYAKYVANPGLMLNDIQNIARNNLERDGMAAMAHGMRLLHPYLDRNIVRLALGFPEEYLFDGARKKILLEVARRAGVPSFILERRKKAMQYGSGIFPVLKRIAFSCISKREAKDKNFAGPLEAYLDSLWREEVLPRFYRV